MRFNDWQETCLAQLLTIFLTFSFVSVPCANSTSSNPFEAEKRKAEKDFGQRLFRASEKHYLSALQVANKDGCQREMAEALAGLTGTSLVLKDTAKREIYFQRTLFLMNKISQSDEHDPEIKLAVADLYDHFLWHASVSDSDEEKMVLIEHAVRLKMPLIAVERKYDKNLLSNLALLASQNMMSGQLCKAEEYEKLAVQLLERAPRTNQSVTDLKAAYNALGNIQTLEKKYAQAEYSFALELSLSHADLATAWWNAGSAHMSLANVLLEDGHYESAQAHAKVGIAFVENGLGPHSDLLSLDYYILGLTQEKLGQKESANRSFKKSVAVSQNRGKRSLAKDFANAHLKGAKVAGDRKAELFFRLWTFPAQPVNLAPVS